MPIRPENRDRYPKDWSVHRTGIRARSGGQCECQGECGREHLTVGQRRNLAVSGYTPGPRCTARNGCAHPITGSTVVLTVAHLDHTPENCAHENLRDMCQRCHLAYDREHHAQTAARTRRLGKAGRDLFDDAA